MCSPSGSSDGVHVLRVLQQHAPTDGRRLQPETQEAERGLAQDHLRNGQRERSDDVAVERGQHVDEDDLQVVAPHQLGGGDEILRAQAEEAAAHDARQAGPADDREDDRDQQVILQLRPVSRQRRAQRHPQRQLRNRQQNLDGALHDVVDGTAQIAGDTADQDPQEELMATPNSPMESEIPVVGVLLVGIVHGEERSQQREQVEQRQHEQGHQRRLVLAETDHDQLPLGRGVQIVQFHGLARAPATACLTRCQHPKKPHPRIDRRQQQVGEEGADHGERAEQHDEASGQVHVLGLQAAGRWWACSSPRR